MKLSRSLLSAMLFICGSFLSTMGFSQSNALNFDGVNDYVELNSLAPALNNSSNFTIEFWMKADYTQQNLQQGTYKAISLFSVNKSNYSNRLLIMMGDLNANTQNGMISIDFGSGNKVVQNVMIGDNKCHHIAYVQDGSTAHLYIDGIHVNSYNVSITLSATDRVSLGQEWDYNATSQFYKGEFDELRLWSTSRSQLAVRTYMHTRLNGSEANLLSYYSFNQGTAYGSNTGINTLTDKTANNHTGNLLGFALSGTTSNWVSESCPANFNALNFDGSNDYADLSAVAPGMSTATDFTVEFWMKADRNQQIIQGNHRAAGMFSINTSAGQNKFLIMMGDVSNNLQNGYISIVTSFAQTIQVQIGDNKCHHIAYVYYSSSHYARVYVDGKHVATIDATINLASNDLYSLGQEWDPGVTSQFYKGDMDEVRIWKTIRSSNDINTNMLTKLTGNETGLLAYYNCDQGIPSGMNMGISDLIDNTGQGASGVLTNFLLNGSTSNFISEPCPTAVSVPRLQSDLGSEDHQQVDGIKVYPNPATDQLTVGLDAMEDQSAMLSVMDITGREVYMAEFSAKTKLNTSELPEGLYIVKVVCGNEIYTKKVVVKKN